MHTLSTQLGDLPLRRALADDTVHVFDIMCDAAGWLEQRGINQWRGLNSDGFHNFLKTRVATWPVYLVDYQSQPIATICLQDSDVHTWTEPGDHEVPAGYVHGLATRGAVRGKGVGRALLAFAERHFREQGKQFLRLDCVADNLALAKYYLGHGYREVRLQRTRMFEKAL